MDAGKQQTEQLCISSIENEKASRLVGRVGEIYNILSGDKKNEEDTE
jgi:hypothetical protein